MSLPPQRYASAGRYPVRGPTFIPRAPAPVGGSGANSGVL
ncbi:unnamed protein product, partial [Rotaria magnacalcarata]